MGSPNFLSFPQSIFPETGDVASTLGDNNLVVDGIQRVPVEATAPLDQQSIVYQASVGTGEYVPTFSPYNRSLLVNNIGVSDDYWVFVNYSDTEVQVNASHAPNGFPILVAGSAAN
jgi:hypothetical protein